MDRVLEMGKVHRFQGLTGREDFDASMVRRLLMGRDTTREDDDETQEVNNGVRRYTVDDDGPGKYRERDLFAMQDTSITCMQIDPQENKFLLTGNTAGVVHLYDMDASDGNTNALHNRFGAASTPSLRRRARYLNATGANPTCEALQSFGPRTSNTGIQGHTASIGALTWYTVDNGLFLTGGSDRRVLSWDTNAFEPAYEFQALGPVQDLAMSTCAALHATHNYCLAAVATSTDSRISLIDIKSCASTHTLVGHTTGGVRRLVWSPDDPYKLVSGGSDGSIRIWDVRKGGKSACVDVLDMNTVEERGEFDADTDSPPAESWCDSPREKRKKQFSQEYYKHKLEKALEDCETSTSSMNAKTKIRKISKPPSDVAFQPQDFSHGRVKESDQRRTRDTNKAHGGPITGMTFPSCRRVIARTSRRKHDLKLDDSSHCEKAVLVSTGTDNELRLWDFSYNDGPRRKLTRFSGISTHHIRPYQMDSIILPDSLNLSMSRQKGPFPTSVFTPDTDGLALLCPSATTTTGGSTEIFELVEGEHIGSLRGHFGAVNSICVRQAMNETRRGVLAPEVYTGGDDGMILRYRPLTT